MPYRIRVISPSWRQASVKAAELQALRAGQYVPHAVPAGTYTVSQMPHPHRPEMQLECITTDEGRHLVSIRPFAEYDHVKVIST